MTETDAKNSLPADGLLPCPFCGRDAISEFYYEGERLNGFEIGCPGNWSSKDTQCSIAPAVSAEYEAEAIAAWNRRPAHEAAIPVAWRCPSCGCHTYAKVDERGEDGHFRPGDAVRCVSCKSVFNYPRSALSPSAPETVLEGGETPTAEELANELWEVMFRATRDRVPDALTDEALALGTASLLAGYHIARKQP